MHSQPRISRRDLIRHAAAGAASLYLSGCAALPRRVRTNTEQALPRLPDRDTFRRLADAALDATSADYISVSLHDRFEGVTRFAGERITAHGQDHVQKLAIVVAFDQQVGSATAPLVTDAIAEAVKTAELKAKAAPPDPDYPPPLPPQRYPVLPTYRSETANAGSARRAAVALEIARLYQTERLRALGIVTTSAEAVGVAASTGLFAFEQRTRADLEATSIGSVVPIRVAGANRSIDDLNLEEPIRRALARTNWLTNPCRLPPGRHAVILESNAVAQLLRPLLDATSVPAGATANHPLHHRLGEQIIDQRLTLRNRPDHPALLGSGFDGVGLPADARTWIGKGVLQRLYYDRLSARAHDTAPTFAPDAWHLSGDEPAGNCVDDLIQATERGILVTNLDRVQREADSDLTLRGYTGGGTFLVEGGEIVGSLTDLEWRESPLRVFNRVQAFSTPLEAVVSPQAVPAHAVTAGTRKMLVPAMKIHDFKLASRPAR